MVCNASCTAAATSCLSKVTGTVAGGGGVGEVVGWRGLRQYDNESGIPVGQYHGGKDSLIMCNICMCKLATKFKTRETELLREKFCTQKFPDLRYHILLLEMAVFMNVAIYIVILIHAHCFSLYVKFFLTSSCICMCTYLYICLISERNLYPILSVCLLKCYMEPPIHLWLISFELALQNTVTLRLQVPCAHVTMLQLLHR